MSILQRPKIFNENRGEMLQCSNISKKFSGQPEKGRPLSFTSQGVGIGLYLTREIVTRQGGYIKVVSEPGQGSAFSIMLPVK